LPAKSEGKQGAGVPAAKNPSPQKGATGKDRKPEESTSSPGSGSKETNGKMYLLLTCRGDLKIRRGIRAQRGKEGLLIITSEEYPRDRGYAAKDKFGKMTWCR